MATKKNYKLTVIEPSGRMTATIQKKKFDLSQLQKAVGGYVQMVGYFKKFEGKPVPAAYVNEEGIMRGMPLNTFASQLWADQYPHATGLYGNIAIQQRTEEEVTNNG